MDNSFFHQEKRKHARYTWERPVKVTAEGLSGVGLIQNISMGGVLLNTDLGLSIEDEVILTVNLPGIADAAQIHCTVRWIDERENAGLLFNGLRAIETKAISQLLLTLSKTEPV